MSSEKFIGINKFCDSIKELTNGYGTTSLSSKGAFCQIGIYFNDWIESKYYKGQYNVKPIGFTLTNSEGKVSYVRYYEIHKYLPEMEFVKFNENKDRKIDATRGSMVKTLFRLIINVEETRSNNMARRASDGVLVYHRSKIIKSDDKITKKLLDNLSEDRIRIVNEAAEMIEDDFEVYEDEPEDFACCT